LATIEPGRQVELGPRELARLVYRPPETDSLWIAVHPNALRAGPRSRLTLVAATDPSDEITWVGAVDEQMLRPLPARRPAVRRSLRDRLLVGKRLWTVVFVRGLVVGDPWRPYLTVYAGSRPWVVLGELAGGELLAVPLNDAHDNPKWYTPVVARGDIWMKGSTKDAQLELAHLWSLDPDVRTVGQIAPRAREAVGQDVWRYYATS
jgi:hypothetical protein